LEAGKLAELKIEQALQCHEPVRVSRCSASS
jgi:hypothetical protein